MCSKVLYDSQQYKIIHLPRTVAEVFWRRIATWPQVGDGNGEGLEPVSFSHSEQVEIATLRQVFDSKTHWCMAASFSDNNWDELALIWICMK